MVSGEAESKPLCTLKQAISFASTLGMTAEEAEFYWHSRNKAGWVMGTQGGGAGRKITSFQSDMATAIPWVREGVAKAKNGGKPQSDYARRSKMENLKAPTIDWRAQAKERKEREEREAFEKQQAS